MLSGRSGLARHLVGADGDVAELLAPRVHFASPYADYDDRDRIVHLFTVMPAVFDELTVARKLTADDETITVLHGRVGDRRLTAVLDEQHDEDGRVHDVTLLIRPLAAARAAITRMGALLEGEGPTLS